MSIFLIFFTAFIWSSSFAFSKLAMDASAPLFATGSRMLVAGWLLAGIALYKDRNAMKLPRHLFLSIFSLAITGFYLTNVCEFIGLKSLSASKACFIYGLSPFVSALFSYIQLKETVTFKKIIGLSIGLIGYLFHLFFGGSLDEGMWTWQLGWPEILLLSATCLSAFGWTLLRRIEKKNSSVSVTVINAYAMLISGVLSLIQSRFVESWDPIPVTNIGLFLRAMVCLIVLSNLISYNLFAKLLRKYSSTFLSFCNLVMPLFSAFYGWVLLGERPTLSLFFAVVSMIIGCRLIYHEEFRQGYIVS